MSYVAHNFRFFFVKKIPKLHMLRPHNPDWPLVMGTAGPGLALTLVVAVGFIISDRVVRGRKTCYRSQLPPRLACPCLGVRMVKNSEKAK